MEKKNSSDSRGLTQITFPPFGQNPLKIMPEIYWAKFRK